MTLLEKLENRDLFTETELGVTEFIARNPQAISGMSVQALAKETYASAPTVVRVCRKLGYSGFKEFKQALLVELEQVKHRSTDVDASRPFTKYETPNRIVGSMRSLYFQSIDATVSMLDMKASIAISHDLFTANRIFLFCYGDTKITSRLFANKLAKLNLYPVLICDQNQELQEIYNIKADDYALFITYKGTSRRLLKCARILRRRGIKTGVITSGSDSPLLTFCSNKLLLPNAESTKKIATFHSQISIGFVLNVLYSLLYEEDYEKHDVHKSMIDDADIL